MEAAKELRDYKLIVVGSGPEDSWVRHAKFVPILRELLGWAGKIGKE